MNRVISQHSEMHTYPFYAHCYLGVKRTIVSSLFVSALVPFIILFYWILSNHWFV